MNFFLSSRWSVRLALIIIALLALIALTSMVATSPSTALVKLLKATSLPSIIKDDLSCHQAKRLLQEKLQKSEAQINRVLIKQKEHLIEFLNE